MIKVIELFAGIGSQTQALKNIGIDHVVVGISEIDKYAIQSYEAIHGKVNNFGNIAKIEKLPYADLWTYSFPCQDLSVAGKQLGLMEGKRSGLLWEVERLLENSERPKYLLLENVKNLIGKQNICDFNKWLVKLSKLGYTSYWQVLNAKDYGVPQNRERVFCISIRNDVDFKGYDFPNKQELKLKLKDTLEDEVDEKYYTSEDKIQKILNSKFMQERKIIQEKDYCDTLLARDYKDPKCIKQIGLLDMKGNEQTRRVYDDNGISPTLNTMQGGNRQPKVLTNDFNNISVIGNYMPSNHDASRVVDSEYIAPTVKENHGTVTATYDSKYRVRKLTPLECWRLTGFKDEQFYKAKESGVSNSQLYKQAGNSIVVNVLEEIFKNLF